MYLFKKALASIGIGNAKVDTSVESQELRPDQPLKGVIRIKGGSVAQQIDKISLELMTQYNRDVDDTECWVKHALANANVSESFTLQSGQTRELPFEMMVPSTCPISMHETKVWLKTALSIANAVDPCSQDYLQILPPPGVRAILQAAGQLGLTCVQAENAHSPLWGGPYPFVQEFEFRVHQGAFAKGTKEVELYFFPAAAGIEVGVEINRGNRDSGALLGVSSEKRTRMLFSDHLLSHGTAAVAGQLRHLIGEAVTVSVSSPSCAASRSLQGQNINRGGDPGAGRPQASYRAGGAGLSQGEGHHRL
jgi:sporulation-control protein